MRPSSLSRALGRGQNWVLGPVSSTGTQSRNVPFRKDTVESVVRTTVAVVNSHLSVPTPLEMVIGDES